MMKVKFRSSRQFKRTSFRRMYGNPWDSSSTSSISSPRTSSNILSSLTRNNKVKIPKKSAFKSNSITRKKISFREPLEKSKSKSKSTTSSYHSDWRSVSSK